MKRFMLVCTAITLVLFTSSLFAGSDGKAAKAEKGNKKDASIIETTDTTGKDVQKNKEEGKAVKEDKEEGKSKEEGKDKQKKDQACESDKKNVGKEKDKVSKQDDATVQADQDKLKKDTVVGSILSIDTKTGVIVVQEENNKSERSIVASQNDIKTLKSGDKVNIELTAGANTAEKIHVIAEGKGGSKAKDKKKK